MTGAKYYLFEWDDAPDFGSPVGDSDLRTSTSYKLTTAEALPFGRYYWRAVSFDAAMNTSGATDSHWFDVTFMKSPMSGSYTTNTKPTFSWAAVPGATLYHIEVADNPDFTSSFGTTVPPSTSYTFATPLAHGKYYWRMMAYTPLGDWGPKMPANQFTVTQPLLPAPVMLTPANAGFVNDAIPMLSWNAVSGTDVTYEVWVDSNTGFTSAKKYGDDEVLTDTSKDVETELSDGEILLESAGEKRPGCAWRMVFCALLHRGYDRPSPAPCLKPPVSYGLGIYDDPNIYLGSLHRGKRV